MPLKTQDDCFHANVPKTLYLAINGREEQLYQRFAVSCLANP